MSENIATELTRPIGYGENYLHRDVKKSFYRISKVPTGKKQKMRWIFNPSFFVRPFQKISLYTLYNLVTVLHPAISGCMPGVKLPDKVKCMYGVDSIYVTDIKSFFKTLNRRVIYKAMDRILYKYITSVSQGIMTNDKEAAVDGSCALKSKEQVTVRHAPLRPTTLINTHKHIYTLAQAHKHSSGAQHATTELALVQALTGYSIDIHVGDQHRNMLLPHDGFCVSSLADNPDNHLVITHLLYLVLAGLIQGEYSAAVTWNKASKHKTETDREVKTTSVIDCLNKGYLAPDPSIKEHAIICSKADAQGGSLAELIAEAGTPAEELELLRRIMFFIVDANTTHMNSLPEGAATSPMLANIVLDSIVSDILTKFRHKPEHIVMYMDDMSLGYNKTIDSNTLAGINKDFDHVLNQYGIKRHLKKTKLFNTKNRREILGVNVTEYKGPNNAIEIRVSRQYRRTMRATLFNFNRFLESYTRFLKEGQGITPSPLFVKENYPKEYSAKSHFAIKKIMKGINGKLSWMQSVSKEQARPYVAQLKEIKARYFKYVQKEVYRRSIGLIDLKLT